MAIKLIIRSEDAAPGTTPFAEHEFDEPIITIGNNWAAILYLDAPSVAPKQATIHNKDSYAFLINHASGTGLNGEPLECEVRRQLSQGDRLDIGPYHISIYLEANTQPVLAAARWQPETEASQQRLCGERASFHTSSGGVDSECEFSAQGRSFAGLLDSLRTEEDSFRFEIVNATGGRQYVGIDNTEMLIGWDETGHQVSCHAASVSTPRACVRKEWSGVVVQPHSPGTVEVNGESVEAARRLRNGDRLTLLPTAVTIDSRESLLIFHEPATLVALGPLLSQQFPRPVAPVQDGAAAVPTQESPVLHTLEPVPAAGPVSVSTQQSYFGYFTLGEVVIMFIGTFVAAVTIFLLMASM
ncbi:MAG: FHA domain-containing protein [Pyrinomonadaceae bacterium]